MIEKIVERLERGETILNHRESGNSMTPRIRHREPFHLAPVNADKLSEGDIVLCRVRGKFYTHLIKAVKHDRVLIGNNRGHINGWTSKDNVFGIVTHVAGRPVSGAAEKVK